jgi:hypothetical protein
LEIPSSCEIGGIAENNDELLNVSKNCAKQMIASRIDFLVVERDARMSSAFTRSAITVSVSPDIEVRG